MNKYIFSGQHPLDFYVEECNLQDKIKVANIIQTTAIYSQYLLQLQLGKSNGYHHLLISLRNCLLLKQELNMLNKIQFSCTVELVKHFTMFKLYISLTVGGVFYIINCLMFTLLQFSIFICNSFNFQFLDVIPSTFNFQI